MAPVSLDAAPLRRPLISIPDAGVHPHLLAAGERSSYARHVGEGSDRLPVHVNSVAVKRGIRSRRIECVRVSERESQRDRKHRSVR